MSGPDSEGPGAAGRAAESLTPMPRGWRLAGVIALLALAGIGLGLWQAASMRRLREAPAATLAILRFENADGDRTLESTCEELPRLLEEELARHRHLRVLPWDETRRLQPDDPAASKVTAGMGASVVIQGSVRRRGSTLRVSVSAVGLRRGVALWSGSFEAAPGRLEEASASAAREIAATLLGLRRTVPLARP